MVLSNRSVLCIQRRMSLIKKIKSRGPLHCVEIAFNRFVPAWLFRFSLGTVLALDSEKLREAITAIENSEFKLLCVEQGSQAREQLRTLTWNSVPIETSSNDFGYSIAYASKPKTVLGGVWGGIETFHENDLGFQLQFNELQSWIYCAYIDQEAQGKGVYKRVLAFAVNDLVEKGYRQHLVVIQPWNKASMHVHQKYARKEVGRIAVVRLLAMCAVFSSGDVVKDRTITFSPHRKPVQLRINA